MKTKTPETDQRVAHISDYDRDLRSGNRPSSQKFVVPADWARKLENQRNKAREEIIRLRETFEKF